MKVFTQTLYDHSSNFQGDLLEVYHGMGLSWLSSIEEESESDTELGNSIRNYHAELGII
jgi:hypothetical protein